MTTRTTPVPLAEASDARTFGGKAAQLAVAAGAGLPVPDGVALPWSFVDAVAAGDPGALADLPGPSRLAPSVAVRSSVVGEDSQTTSFAGLHASLLGVRPAALADAVCAVWRSARSEAARAYRRRMGLAADPQVGVVVQEMVDADVGGVIFCPNPITGDDELVIEAAWGLGEAVVAGLVTPDLFRLSRQGDVLERRPGVKDLQVRTDADGGTVTRPVDADRAEALCLDDGQLAALHQLATACVDVFGGSQDLEWAVSGERVRLLQRRAITGVG